MFITMEMVIALKVMAMICCEHGPINSTVGENMYARFLNMFNLRICNSATIRYSLLMFGHMHLCGIDYECI